MQQPHSKDLYHLIVGSERKNKVMNEDYRVAKSGATPPLHLNKSLSVVRGIWSRCPQGMSYCGEKPKVER